MDLLVRGGQRAGSVVRHLRSYADGYPLTGTRGFEEREAPFKRLRPAELLRAIERGEEEMRSEVAAIVATEPDAVLTWTRRQMRIDAFLTHLRSECSIHRWDLVGDDDKSLELPGAFDLLKHAVTAIGAGPMTARGVAARAAVGEARTARVRSEGQPDLVVMIGATVSPRARRPGGGSNSHCRPGHPLADALGLESAAAESDAGVTGRRDDVFQVRRLLSGC